MARRKRTEGELVETKDRMYFPVETEDAIVRFNLAESNDERETIYRQDIAYPLDKLAENIINRFKFPYVNQSFEETKRQVVSFLVTNLHKYSKDKGKAFSYFSVIAKNYLILHNNNGYKQEKRNVYLSETGEDYISIDEVDMLQAPDPRAHEDSKEFVRLMITYWDDNLTRIFKKKRDIDIASAVVELFRRAETIENFNKKALYLMIREMTDCKTSYITKVVNKMRVHTLRQLQEFHSDGTINGDEPDFFKYD
jgi:hypothetical protein